MSCSASAANPGARSSTRGDLRADRVRILGAGREHALDQVARVELVVVEVQHEVEQLAGDLLRLVGAQQRQAVVVLPAQVEVHELALGQQRERHDELARPRAARRRGAPPAP